MDMLETIINYFSYMSPWAGGFGSAAYLGCFLAVFCYVIIRGFVDNPAEKTLDIVLVPLVVTMFMAFLGFDALTMGIIAIATYVWAQKIYLKMTYKDTIIGGVQLFIIFAVFGILESTIRWIVTIGFIAYYYIESSKQLKEKKKKAPGKK
ncbi:MAG: hypothetical protein AABW59_01595 [archaeon]